MEPGTSLPVPNLDQAGSDVGAQMPMRPQGDERSAGLQSATEPGGRRGGQVVWGARSHLPSLTWQSSNAERDRRQRDGDDKVYRSRTAPDVTAGYGESSHLERG